MAVYPLIEAIENVIPACERYKLVFEEQQSLGFYRDKMLQLLAYILSHPPPERRHVKRPILVGWETIRKGQTCLCEPADYLCYHLEHKAKDPNSVRTLWTMPIMRGESIWKSHLSRAKARSFFQELPGLEWPRPKNLAIWKKQIRSGQIDPWTKVLERREEKSRREKNC